MFPVQPKTYRRFISSRMIGLSIELLMASQ